VWLSGIFSSGMTVSGLRPALLTTGGDYTLIAELSKDSVDALRKKVEGRVKKIEVAKSAMKAGWEVEVDKLVAGEWNTLPHRVMGIRRGREEKA